MKLIFLVAILVGNTISHAGTETTNGGEECERKIKLIRNAVKDWIESSGPTHLKFPVGVSLQKYRENMLSAIKSATISCTSVKLPLSGAEKTCLNSTEKDGAKKILCNFLNFNNDEYIKESERYTLIHHSTLR